MTDTFDPQKIFEALETAREEMVLAEAKFLTLDKLDGPTLDKYTGEILASAKQAGEKMSMAEASMRARGGEKYKTHCDGWVVARNNYTSAKAKFENWRILAELRRTQESSRRALTR